MKYKCLLCNKEFSQKSNFDVHNRRKNKCNIKYNTNIDDKKSNKNNTINYTNLHSNYTETTLNYTQITPNLHSITPNYINNIHQEINIKNNSLCCNYCGNTFTRKQSLDRHQLKSCKNKNIINDTIIYTITDTITNTNTDTITEELQKIKEDNIKLKEEINELKQSNQNLAVVRKSKNKNSSNTNNGTINIQNNIHNNYIINKTNNFGEEDLTLIPDIDKLIALKGKKEAFMNYFLLVNFNEKYPQFQNLLIKNLRANIGSIVENNSLVVKPIREILESIVNTRLPEIEDLMDKFKIQNLLSQLEVHTLKETINFLKNAYLETEDVDGNLVKANREMARKLKDFYEKLKLMIYNNNEMVNKNITKFLLEPLFNPLLDPINQLINDELYDN